MRTRVIVLLALTAAALRTLPLGWLHPLNWDEIEYFRATDWVAHGRVPFRDFWEHHTPLQWFVFAPVARFVTGHGADAVLAMRWAQVPLWIATFALAMVLMRRAGLDPFARWSAIAIVVCSSFFMLPAIEYRIDALGCALYVAGLVLAPRRPFAAGAVFAAAGLANIRLGPLLAVTVLLLRVVDLGERRWRNNARANWIFAGALAALGVASAYFFATGSLGAMVTSVWTDNALGNRYATNVAGGFVHRVLVPFGLRIIGEQRAFDPAGFDAGGVALLVLGLGGLLVALRRWRTPDEVFVIAVLQIVSVAFIAAMKFVYNYHFEIVAVLMLPLIAVAVEQLRRPAVIIAIVAGAWLVNGFASVFRGKELDLRYQDAVMREVHARTRPGDKVWDGVGWALRREPAYRFWFLPDLARQLVLHAGAAPYRLGDPPAAVVADHNALMWLHRNRDLQAAMVRHYLPAWRSVWVPAMNARIEPGQTVTWRVPADGAYRLYASARLAGHPWFRTPLFVASYHEADARRLEVRLGSPAPAPALQWPAVSRLRKGEVIEMTSRAAEPLGVFLVPGGERVLFRQPAPGVTLDSATPRVTHVPRLW